MLLLSVDGVGPVLAAHLLACTEGFTRFATARRLACQAGVASTSTLRAPASMVAHAYLHKPTAC
ncbi:MAG: transposase [Flavobacteriales bacterium]|nr:transposase [Flavobacteriales bacterium]